MCAVGLLGSIYAGVFGFYGSGIEQKKNDIGCEIRTIFLKHI